MLSLFVLFHFLHEPRLQGTEQPPQPVWTPVALTGTTPMAAEANATAQANDTTASDLQAQPEYATRWTEVNPVSSVAKCSEDNTAEPAGCKWTRVSQPLQLRLSHAPYIAKAHASGVYVVLHDDTAGKVRRPQTFTHRACVHSVVTLCCNACNKSGFAHSIVMLSTRMRHRL